MQIIIIVCLVWIKNPKAEVLLAKQNINITYYTYLMSLIMESKMFIGQTYFGYKICYEKMITYLGVANYKNHTYLGCIFCFP